MNARRVAVAALLFLQLLVGGIWFASQEARGPASDSPDVVRAPEDRSGPRRPRVRAAPESSATPASNVPASAAESEPDPARPGFDRTIDVLAADGSPMIGALVSSPGAEGGAVSARTDKAGRAVLARTRPGAVVLEIDRPPADTTVVRTTRVVVLGTDTASVRLEALRVLRGSVTAEGGRPTQVLVFCRSAGAGPGTRAEEIPLHGDGSFATEVGAGRYDVWTEPAGPAGTRWFHEPRLGVDPASEEVRLHLGVADGFSCRLRPDGVEGKGLLGGVYPSPSGGPISFPETPNVPAFGGPIGTLRVAPGRDYDVWTKVAASQTGPAVAWGVVRGVRPGGRVEITVRPAWTLRVTLEDLRGERVRSSVWCVPWPERVEPAWVAMFATPGPTSSDGEAVFRGLPPIPVEMQVGGPGFDWVAAEPSRVEPGTDSVVVRVTPTVALRGRLTDERGRPVGARVRVEGDWAHAPRTLTAESDPRTGRFEFEHLPPGRVRATWGVDDVVAGPLGEIDLPAAGEVVWVARAP